MIRQPSARSCATFRCVAGWFHMTSFMDGASSIGWCDQSMADAMRLTTSSARPAASRASMSMVHGAISMVSAALARLTCCGSCDSMCSQGLVYTGRPDNAWKVSGATNRVADSVMTTVTSMPSCTSLLTTCATL